MNRFFQPAITAVLLSAALVVIAVTLLSGSVAQGASYRKTDGTIVDPIMDNGGSTHLYSGNDLEPGAYLPDADLFFADLTNADLFGADLFFADLAYADLTNADLFSVDLFGANLTGANLSHANLDFADLGNATLTNATFSTGTTLYDGQTVLQHGFDAAGLQAYLEAFPVNASYAANIILVPEPHTLLLASLASMGLTLRRRRSAR